VGPARVDLILEGLEALPVHAELAHAARSEIAPGGSCNVAIACSRLGLRSVLVAPVCQDDLGSMLTARLAGAGVDWVGLPGACARRASRSSSGERVSGDPRPVPPGKSLLGPRAVIGRRGGDSGLSGRVRACMRPAIPWERIAAGRPERLIAQPAR
jgi:hypothetical protein